MTARPLQRNAFTFLESIVVMLSVVLLASIVIPGIFRKDHINDAQKIKLPVLEVPTMPGPSSPQKDTPEEEGMDNTPEAGSVDEDLKAEPDLGL